MGLIHEEHKERIRSELEEKIAALSDKIKLEVYDLWRMLKKLKSGVDKVPAIAIVGEKDHGIRFYGLPYGYEFQTFLEGIVAVSRGKSDLSEEVKARLRDVKARVHIQVFVTLTCPYCSSVAGLAYKVRS